MTGFRTYITLIALVLFNIFTAVFKIEGLTQESIEATINVILLIVAGIFHFLHKPKV
jgi:hypothetical protein